MTYTMLLADDSVTTHRVMELTFAGEDIQVVSVADGQQAVERLRASRPDIVVAEAALPGLDGYQLAEHVRRTPELADVPVLLLTGAFDVIDEPRVRAAGAAGIIVKPFEPETVIKRVKDLLGISSHEADAASTRLVTSFEPPADEPIASDAPPLPPPASSGDDGAATTSALHDLEDEIGKSSPAATGDRDGAADSFAQLGDAFDDLDQQLSESTTAPRTTSATAARETGRTSSVFPPSFSGSGGSATAGDEPPVFEIDEEWFGGNLARAASARIPSAGSDVADSFQALLAAEQGTPSAFASAPAAEPIALSDDAIERIATRVAERLSEGVFVETVRNVVEGVAERLVREEIARIRASAQEQRR